MRVAIIDYGSGNLRSAQKAFQRAAREAGLNAAIGLATTAEEVLHADRVVLPGVGAFADCLRGIEAIDGMRAALQEVALRQGRPFLGICVGMQLMASRGLEHGDHAGLDWIPGSVVPIEPADKSLKIPHMGWNELHMHHPHPVLDVLKDTDANGIGSHVYFVHSYHFRPASEADLLATTDYGGPITAAVGHGNLLGFQFHPEKSQRVGLALIEAFLKWSP